MDEAEPDPGRPDDTAAGPLPRRSRQQHLEPQLRVVGGSGDGTPFSAFDDGTRTDGTEPGGTEPGDESTPDGPGDRATAAARAAAFHRATGRDA